MSHPPSRVAELSLRAIVLGLLLSVVMGAANVYVGLKAGMTVSASIPAAVMAMLVFRTLFRNSTILEANQVQTAASAGESLAAGVIYTMPALVLIGYWSEFDFWTVAAISFTGGLLGILFMIPMRKVFVHESSELPYPEGVACAVVLQAGESTDRDARSASGLVFGALLGGVFKALVTFVGLVRGTFEGAAAVGGRALYFGADMSPLLIAVGFIVRLEVALMIALGGAIGWLVAIPALGGLNVGTKPLDHAWDLWSSDVRYLGVGAMAVGGIASIFAVRRGLLAAVRELRGGLRSSGASERERDLPAGVIAGLAVFSIVAIGAIYYRFTGHVGTTLLSTAVMVVAAFFFTAVASYIVGLVGNSNSPVSGMTITAVLFAGGMLYVFGYSGMEGMVACLGVAAVVCCVACTSGDVCNDLKTGAIVGAAPYRQQIMQILGVAVASLVMAPVLDLLNRQYVIGSPELSAPQASLFANLVRGVFGDGTLPWDMVGIGALVGVAILVADRMLVASGARFRLHLMPVAVGIYLPFGLVPPILIGGLLAHFVARGSRDEQETERRMQPGVLFSSGVIAGEALMGVGLALLAARELGTLAALAGRAGVELPSELTARTTLWGSVVAGVIAVACFGYWTRRRDP